jgi:hypothetical protein
MTDFIIFCVQTDFKVSNIIDLLYRSSHKLKLDMSSLDSPSPNREDLRLLDISYLQSSSRFKSNLCAQPLRSEISGHEAQDSSASDLLIRFALRSGPHRVYQSYYESTLRKWTGRSRFFSAIVSGEYQRNHNNIYDLTDYTIESFNWVMKYISSGKIDRLTNVMDHHELYQISMYLGLPNELVRYVDISVDRLFYHNLTDTDLEMRLYERSVREILYANEDTDFRGEDVKFTLGRVINSRNFFDRSSEMTSNLRQSELSHYTKVYKNQDYYFISDPNDVCRDKKTTNVLAELSNQQIRELFSQYISGLFDGFDFTDLVIAGGCISNFEKLVSDTSDIMHLYYTLGELGDIDIFIITKDPTNAKIAIRRLLNHLKAQYPNVLFLRTENAITILGIYPDDNCIDGLVVQIILRLYNSVTQVISGFDIDSCCVAYDCNELYCMPRFLRSTVQGYNLVDPERQSLNYGYRLFKYLTRGFRIALPGYDHERVIKTSINNPSATGLARIINQVKRNRIHNMDIMDDTNPHDYTSYKFIHPNSLNRYIRNIGMEHRRSNNVQEPESKWVLMPEWEDQDNEDTIQSINQYLIRHNIEVNVKASYSIDQILNDSVDIDMTPLILRGVKSNLPDQIKFKTRNVGTQLTNSFNPTFEDWYRDLYSVIID